MHQWIRWPLRLTSSLAALLLFDQAVFAGQFLAGAFPALQTHRDNATYAGVAVLTAAAAAALIRWPGRGPIWPTLAFLGLFGLIAAQIALGFARVLALHIPLGVLIILTGGLLAAWSWRYRPAVVAVAPRPTGTASVGERS
ncbi:hypothetical protein ODJ79_14525 [Actinoplanes sp. KI2]|uniref:hypothetical protein n=1 Tax=Actinoplanes sp. KI2 TaxID=2983315 RepID=UPI0021D5F9EC|nr:hypothetical protein [Actinoplanes sp. KI2]MCU7724939.1 hypothetical protein [Actinoplanes sp. KI2]